MLKKALFLSLVIFANLFLSSCENSPGSGSRSPEVIRVACVGDSITYGVGIENRWWNSYPAQLNALLGKGWEVRNFGVNNATALKRGYFSYADTKEYADALAFSPHVVIILLGTNDARPVNWRFKDEFGQDYLALIEEFQALGSRPRIWLGAPPPAFWGKGGEPYPVIQNEIIPEIRDIARKKGLPIIDINKALFGRQELFADDVHPNERGARVIAEKVYGAIEGRRKN